MNIKESLFFRDTYWTITLDCDCSHEIKRCFLLGRKAMTKLGSTLKSRDITLLIKVLIFKLLVTQPCLTLWDPMGCSLPASSAHGTSGKNTGVGCHSLLQGIFLTQGSNQPRSLVLSHVWMWELDRKVWVPKNWCFQTVVLEKTLESSLDWKEIKPVHPKGNQSWILIRRTNAEAEAPILWPPNSKN